jgi:hypothetical protein
MNDIFGCNIDVNISVLFIRFPQLSCIRPSGLNRFKINSEIDYLDIFRTTWTRNHPVRRLIFISITNILIHEEN